MITVMRCHDDGVAYAQIFLGVVIGFALILATILGVSSVSSRRACLDALRPTETTQQR